MRARYFFATTAVLAIVFTVALVVTLALPAAASPRLQDDGENIPTPTPHPVLSLTYELSVVGGTEEVLTFPAETVEDSVTVGETTAFPNYPSGVEFTTKVALADEEASVNGVTLFIRFEHGSGSRVIAEYNEEEDVWTATPWETGEGQPAWTHFNFYWSVTDSNGNTYQTESHEMDYADPNREWFRVETPHIIVYWFGFGEDNAAEIAEDIAESLAGTEERRQIGFDGAISYKPVAVIFPTREALAEMYGSGATNSNAAGFTSSDLGMTVQHISMPTDEWYERQSECVWLTSREERTIDRRIRGTVFGTLPHESVHLYQFEFGLSRGPLWWTEGQAEYFSYAPGSYDTRLRYLASLNPELPPLNPGTGIGANTFQADGCYALAYSVGPSFINWLLTNYGGLETHREITRAMNGNISMFDAIEEVTGKTFLELENEWRAYLGFNQLELADVDPLAALEDPIDAVFQDGDVITIPGFRPLPMANEPGGLGNVPCMAGTDATILRSGSLEGINYYELDCGGAFGWVEEAQINE